MTRAKLYMNKRVGARTKKTDVQPLNDLYIDEAHTALDIFRFAVFLLLETEIHIRYLQKLNFSCLNSSKVASRCPNRLTWAPF